MNRTIRDKIQTHFNLTETLKYYDIIENHELENTINNTYNRSIDEAPISLTNENIENNNKILRKSNTEKFKKLNLNIGDNVRIRLKRDKFQKAGNRYSKSIHKITDIYG